MYSRLLQLPSAIGFELQYDAVYTAQPADVKIIFERPVVAYQSGSLCDFHWKVVRDTKCPYVFLSNGKNRKVVGGFETLALNVCVPLETNTKSSASSVSPFQVGAVPGWGPEGIVGVTAI
jgi:hypothetical protein